jgi:hypothetical protein
MEEATLSPGSGMTTLPTQTLGALYSFLCCLGPQELTHTHTHTHTHARTPSSLIWNQTLKEDE